MNHVDLLKRRGLLFFEYAKEALSKEHYDMCMFYAAQALQLMLKALALRMLGYVPRTHSIREIIALIVKTLRELSKRELAQLLEDFSRSYRDALRILEEAYIASRYLEKSYERDDAERAVKVVEEAINILGKIEQCVFE